MKFIGRFNELNNLKKAYDTEGYEGILIYGRRRIGKSELIKYSYRNENCKIIYFEATKVSEESNTIAFNEIIASVFKIPAPNFHAFKDALNYVFEQSLSEKIILVIDEYPYLREKITECDSVFQNVIDTYAMNCNLKLILCGSYVDIMKNLLDKDNPLYKRLSVNINLKQMDYYESALFYPNFSNEDKVRIYSVFGGLPYYNRYIDDKKSVKENIIDLIASPDSRFDGDPERMVEKEIAKMANANEVFMAIAKGYCKFSDILGHSNVTSSPTLVDVLGKLISMDIVKKECPINDESNKKSIYTISDRLTLFYYRYIFPKASYFSTMPPDAFYEEFIAEDFETQYVPKQFEEVSKQYLLRKNLAGKIKPVLYKIGKYYYDDPKKRKNGEFDVVTQSKDGYDFYEVKFSKNPVDDKIIAEEKRQLETAGVKYNKLGFISRSGFSISQPEMFNLIDLSEIYK